MRNFFFISIMQTVRGLAATTETLLTGNFSSTNTTSQDPEFLDPTHIGAMILGVGGLLMQISGIHSLKKLLQSENLEQAIRYHITASLQAMTGAACINTAMVVADVSDLTHRGELALGIVVGNFFVGDLAFWYRIGIAEDRAAAGQADSRLIKMFPLIHAFKVLATTTLMIAEAFIPSYTSPFDSGTTINTRINWPLILIITRLSADIITKQHNFSDYVSVAKDYCCCFFPPCRRRVIAGADPQQIQQPLLR